jgi:predicted transcriptional regulator YdeE
VNRLQVTELKELKLIGIRLVCEGDQYAIEIPKTAVILKQRLSEIKQLVYPVNMIGAYIAGDFSMEEDGYWACVEVNEIADIPEGMAALTVPSQKYAVIRHSGPIYEVVSTYEVLHRWIEENGFERIRRSWHVEISTDWGSGNANEIVVDLYDTIKT